VRRQWQGLSDGLSLVGSGGFSDSLVLRSRFDAYREAVYYLETEDAKGEKQIGSSFHVGDGIFITAKHVVEGRQITDIGWNGRSAKAKGAHIENVFLHPSDAVDVAAIEISGATSAYSLKPPIAIPLGDHLEDWPDSDSYALDAFALTPVVALGYPPIPFSDRPVLAAVTGEVSAVVGRYDKSHPHFVLSSLPRGGFSGGPVIERSGHVLGAITESLVRETVKGLEPAFLATISVQPIFECLVHHGILPRTQTRLRRHVEKSSNTV
jgi:hypothetical protein